MAASWAPVFAAVHPDRLRALVIVDGWARARVDTDHPIGLSPEEVARRVEQSEMSWGQGMMLDAFAPGMRGIPGLREAWAATSGTRPALASLMR